MKELPAGLEAYKRTPTFTEETTPAGLRRQHNTKAGTWGRICIVSGTLLYRILEPVIEEVPLAPGADGVVEPEVPHEVVIQGPVEFFVEFLRPPG